MTPQQLRKERMKRGVTGAHVRKQLGISSSYLADMEKGRRPMSDKVRAAYEKILTA